MILRTIHHVFPSCRIFREHLRKADEIGSQGEHDFANMVNSCTKQQRLQPSTPEAYSSTSITFRVPTEADVLNSPTRRAFIMPKADNELQLAYFTVGLDQGLLTRNDTHKVARWHEESARGHWEVMRDVLPSLVWESW